jgi:hypothetical protein
MVTVAQLEPPSTPPAPPGPLGAARSEAHQPGRRRLGSEPPRQR